MIRSALEPQIKSSFLSVEKDIELILKKLFYESKSASEQLLRLLTIQTKDCLSDLTNDEYITALRKLSLGKLIEDGYIKLEPKIYMPEHEKVKSYIIISLDNFTPNDAHPDFRDCTINFDIICHTDYWRMDNYQVRPIKIAGYIDGILNGSHLSGLGQLNFIGCKELVLDENLAGYTLTYRAVHWTEDTIND